MRRLLGILVSMVLVLAASAIARTEQASAEVRLTFLHWNICGNVCNGGRSAVVGDVADLVRSRYPYVVTLNEVCRNQHNSLYAAHLESLGYTRHFFRTAPIKRCSNGAEYGNSIFVRGRHRDSSSWNIELTTPSGVEDRRLSCVETYAYDFLACVTHLTPPSQGGDAIRNQQAIEIEQFVRARRQAGKTVMIGGDFNSTPNKEALNHMFGNCYPAGHSYFRGADLVDCVRNSDSGESTFKGYGGPKYDYAFFSRGFRLDDLNADATNADLGLHSDHDALWAWATRL